MGGFSMATKAEQDRRKRLLPLLVLLGVAALCLISLAAGWITSPLWDSMFGGGGGGTASDGGGNGGGGGGDGGGGCLLNIVCFNASGDDSGADAEATIISP
jgi:hypothetical protein